MTDDKKSSKSAATWIVAIVSAIIILLFISAGVFLLQPGVDSDDTTAEMTPVIGGMTAPTATPDLATPDSNGGSQPLGEIVVGGSATAASLNSGGVRVYSDARADAVVMDIYEDGAAFVVLEPSGEYDAYPVEQNGAQWVRIRTDDGLVGWAALAELASAE